MFYWSIKDVIIREGRDQYFATRPRTRFLDKLTMDESEKETFSLLKVEQMLEKWFMLALGTL